MSKGIEGIIQELDLIRADAEDLVVRIDDVKRKVSKLSEGLESKKDNDRWECKRSAVDTMEEAADGMV